MHWKVREKRCISQEGNHYIANTYETSPSLITQLWSSHLLLLIHFSVLSSSHIFLTLFLAQTNFLVITQPLYHFICYPVLKLTSTTTRWQLSLGINIIVGVWLSFLPLSRWTGSSIKITRKLELTTELWTKLRKKRKKQILRDEKKTQKRTCLGWPPQVVQNNALKF